MLQKGQSFAYMLCTHYQAGTPPAPGARTAAADTAIITSVNAALTAVQAQLGRIQAKLDRICGVAPITCPMGAVFGLPNPN